jgi:hypothetical protein
METLFPATLSQPVSIFLAGNARVMLQYLTDRMYDEVRGPGE